MLRKRDKLRGLSRISSLFHKFNKFNKTWALMQVSQLFTHLCMFFGNHSISIVVFDPKRNSQNLLILVWLQFGKWIKYNTKHMTGVKYKNQVNQRIQSKLTTSNLKMSSFGLILYILVNNFSAISGLVFLVWTSTMQPIKCLAKGHNTLKFGC